MLSLEDKALCCNACDIKSEIKQSPFFLKQQSIVKAKAKRQTTALQGK